MKDFSYSGFYRAKVVEVDLEIDDEKNDYGAIRVFIPDMMTDIDENFDEDETGLIAYPAFSLGGGFNPDAEDSHFTASVIIPRKGSWVFVFFEGNSPSKPYYFASFRNKSAKLPPECRDGEEPHKVALLYKSVEGRAIVISDDEKNARVEITGKKRKMKEGPEGDKKSVTEIDKNQTVILLDEREGKEKILIKTHKGDFININIEDQELHIKFKGDIIFNTDKSIHFKAGKDILLKASGNVNVSAGKGASLSGGTSATVTGLRTTIKASTIVAIDGVLTTVQGGIGNCTGGGGGGSPREAKGDRDGKGGGGIGGLLGGLGGNGGIGSMLGGGAQTSNTQISEGFNSLLEDTPLNAYALGKNSPAKSIDSFITSDNIKLDELGNSINLSTENPFQPG